MFSDGQQIDPCQMHCAKPKRMKSKGLRKYKVLIYHHVLTDTYKAGLFIYLFFYCLTDRINQLRFLVHGELTANFTFFRIKVQIT